MQYNVIISLLNKLGYNTISADYYRTQERWLQWYNGTVEKFHKLTIDIGAGQKVEYNRYKSGMAKQVCEDWADLLLSEKVTIALGAKAENDYVQNVLKHNAWQSKANEQQEAKAAYGTAAYVPHITGAVIDDCGTPTGQAAGIDIDYINGDAIFPLSWHNGQCKEVCFAKEQAANGKEYILLQLHVIADDGTYHIRHILFERSRGTYKEVPLSTLAEYAHIEPELFTGTSEPQFVLDKLAIRNPMRGCGPMGISVYAGAIDQLKAVDVAYDSYVNEFVLGKKRIIVKLGAMKDAYTGEPVFDTSDLVYYALPEDGEQTSLIKEIDMTLRTDQHSKGIQDMLNVLSHRCGLGNNYYSFDQGNFSTATHVISAESKLFRTLKKHEAPLEASITQLVRIILHLANKYAGQSFNEDVDVKVNFDDSIIEDTGTEFDRHCRMVGIGAMAPWEMRQRYLGETAEEAKKNTPKLDTLTGELPPEE